MDTVTVTCASPWNIPQCTLEFIEKLAKPNSLDSCQNQTFKIVKPALKGALGCCHGRLEGLLLTIRQKLVMSDEIFQAV